MAGGGGWWYRHPGQRWLLGHAGRRQPVPARQLLAMPGHTAASIGQGMTLSSRSCGCRVANSPQGIHCLWAGVHAGRRRGDVPTWPPLCAGPALRSWWSHRWRRFLGFPASRGVHDRRANVPHDDAVPPLGRPIAPGPRPVDGARRLDQRSICWHEHSGVRPRGAGRDPGRRLGLRPPRANGRGLLGCRRDLLSASCSSCVAVAWITGPCWPTTLDIGRLAVIGRAFATLAAVLLPATALAVGWRMTALTASQVILAAGSVLCCAWWRSPAARSRETCGLLTGSPATTC